MYSQTFLVTSVRGSVDLPQIAASSVLSFFGAKMPLQAFFAANAFFLPGGGHQEDLEDDDIDEK